MIQCEKLQHVGIIVSDAQASAKWYTDYAGFRKKAEFMASGSKVIFVYHDSSEMMLELIERPPGSDQSIQANEGEAWIDHLAFAVRDVENEFEKAKNEHLEIIEGICDVPDFWDHGFRYFLLRSATGEKIEYCKVL